MCWKIFRSRSKHLDAVDRTPNLSVATAFLKRNKDEKGDKLTAVEIGRCAGCAELHGVGVVQQRGLIGTHDVGPHRAVGIDAKECAPNRVTGQRAGAQNQGVVDFDRGIVVGRTGIRKEEAKQGRVT